jgi:hypothetical protein
MGPGKLGLSAIDKRDIWSRWKAAQTLHEIGALTASVTTRFARCCCLAVASLR